MTNIETGVDRLVQLIKGKKRITVADAAKQLGVSKIVLQEWADFLQEEKVIDIDYKLTSTWLIEKRMTEEDIKKRGSEFESIKDNFIRKVETSIGGINRETEGLKKIKTEFDRLKKDIGKEVEKVKDEVKELESFENLKRNIDQEIINQQAEFRNSIKDAHKQLLEEEKKYQNIINSIEREKDEVKMEETDIKTLRIKEDQLKSKLNEIKSLMENINKGIDDDNSKIGYTKEHVKELEKAADKIEQTVIKKRESIDPLLKKSKEHEEKINQIQNRLLEKVLEKKATINQAKDEGKEIIDKFNKFFERKAQVDMLLMKIEEDKVGLKTELNNLIKKAKMFDIVASSKSSDKYVKELKIAMEKIDHKKDIFKNEINKLLSLVGH